MSRSRIIPRWTAAALLAGAIAIGATGCVAVPVGGYDYGPSVVLPAPGVVIAPGHGHGHHRRGHYRGRYYGGRGYYGHRGHWR